MGAVAFLAPSPPSFDFFEAAEAVVVIDAVDAAGEELRRDAPSFDAGREPGEVVEERREEELMVRGAAVAEAARPSTGTDAAGVLAELVGLEAGLSHEEKKSSSSAPAPLDAAAAATSVMPSTKMRSGCLVANGQTTQVQQQI